MRNTRERDPLRELLVKKVAEKHGVTPRHVNYILKMGRENEKILADYMEIKEGVIDVFNNALLDSVNKLVPFN